MTELAPVGTSIELARKVLEHWYAGAAQETRRARTQDLMELATFISPTDRDPNIAAVALLGGSRLNGLDLAHRWNRHMADIELSPGTRARRLSTIRGLCKFASQFGVIDWRLDISSPPTQTNRDVRGPSRKRVEDAISTLTKQSKDGSVMACRNLALLCCLFDLGLRVSSVIRLRPDQFEIDPVTADGCLKDVWLKNSRVATKRMLSMRARDALLDWFDHLDVRSDLIFPITDRTVRLIIQHLGLGHPHGLRHTAATILLDCGASHREVQAFLEHRDSSTTDRYIDALTTDHSKTVRLIAGELDDTIGYDDTDQERKN
jgi:site-specific recombinase XerD